LQIDRLAAYHNKHVLLTSFPGVPTSMTLSDLELQKWGISELVIFLQFQAAANISRVNCAEITGDRHI